MCDDDIMKVLTEPTVDVPLASRVLGISSNTAYKAVHDGSLPAFKIAGRFRVPTSKLREMLGLPPRAPASGTAPIAA